MRSALEKKVARENLDGDLAIIPLAPIRAEISQGPNF